jgi:hypothetical protein
MRAVDLFEVLASMTWQTIFRANKSRIMFGEDAITSINLSAIASLNRLSIAVEDTRVDESRKGCDFELWIGSDGIGWLRYAVQAKKISAGSGRYDQLNHKVRGRPQIDILKAYSRRVRAAPLYCFYNFAFSASAWNCVLPRDEPQLGCMVTPAAVVEKALRTRRGSRNFSWMHLQPESIPWRCLLTCRHKHPHKYPEDAPSLWIAKDDHYHKNLPKALQVLRRDGRNHQLVDSTALRYEGTDDLFPRWTAIVDTTGED